MAFDFNKWWQANGADRNAERKKRYREDPEYRQQVQAVNLRSRSKKQKLREKEQKEADKHSRVSLRPKHSWKSYPLQVDGVQVAGFTVGALAATLNRSVQSLRAWEDKGLIPKPDGESPKGDRLYTAATIEAIHASLEAAGRLRETGRQRRGLPHVTKRVRFPDGSERDVVLFQVAALAVALDKTIVTVQHLESRGVLPVTPFRASVRRYRLYTAEQIATAKQVYDSVGKSLRTDDAKTKFTAVLTAKWSELGIAGACVIEEEQES